MASAASNNHCKECENGVTTCDGCTKHFCVEHFMEHRQALDERMDGVGQEYNNLKENLDFEETKHPLFSRIERWKEESMKKIEYTARQAQLDLRNYIARTVDPLKQSLKQIDDHLKSSHPSKNYTEKDLDSWMKRLEALRNTFQQRPNIDLVEEDTPTFVRKVIVVDKSVSQNDSAAAVVVPQLGTPWLMTNSSFGPITTEVAAAIEPEGQHFVCPGCGNRCRGGIHKGGGASGGGRGCQAYGNGYGIGNSSKGGTCNECGTYRRSYRCRRCRQSYCRSCCFE